MRKNRARTRTLLRRAAVTSFPRQARSQNHHHRIDNGDRLWHSEAERHSETDRYYLEGVGYLIGDISCEYNARCGYLRCAVNPSGPCDGCRFYEERKELASKNMHA